MNEVGQTTTFSLIVHETEGTDAVEVARKDFSRSWTQHCDDERQAIVTLTQNALLHLADHARDWLPDHLESSDEILRFEVQMSFEAITAEVANQGLRRRLREGDEREFLERIRRAGT